MKISVIMDISVLRFYEYIGYIGEYFGKKISVSLKLIKIYKKKKWEKLHKNVIRSILIF